MPTILLITIKYKVRTKKLPRLSSVVSRSDLIQRLKTKNTANFFLHTTKERTRLHTSKFQQSRIIYIHNIICTMLPKYAMLPKNDYASQKYYFAIKLKTDGDLTILLKGYPAC